MNKTIEATIRKSVYKDSDKATVQKALQDIADTFTPNELAAIAKKVKNSLVQLQIRSML